MVDGYSNPLESPVGTFTNPGTAGSAGAAVTCVAGGPASLERVRFYQRQLVTAADLNQLQDYLRARLRRHNRLMHGWGVVCGGEVAPAAADWSVTIPPLYALGPQGDEIVVDEPLTVDLRREGLDGHAASACHDPADPWCSSVQVARKPGTPLYLAVAYAECPARPVRVQPAGCGCEDGQCEYSRIRDGHAVRVLTELPSSHAELAGQPPSPTACPRPCPDCVTEPWVVLAQITPSGKTIQPEDIDNVTYRRYAISFANWWFRCGAPAPVAATLRVAAMRMVATGDDESDPDAQVIAELESPLEPWAVPLDDRITAIEVEFEASPDDPLDAGSVVSGESFLVGPGAIVVPGHIAVVSDDKVRWLPDDVSIVALIQESTEIEITLKGAKPAIRTQAGASLDGEPSASLPSGDGTAGGDFVVTVTFQHV
jgi:hypothetical protein